MKSGDIKLKDSLNFEILNKKAKQIAEREKLDYLEFDHLKLVALEIPKKFNTLEISALKIQSEKLTGIQNEFKDIASNIENTDLI